MKGTYKVQLKLLKVVSSMVGIAFAQHTMLLIYIQSLKADFSILLTELPIVTDVKDLHSLKADSPIEVTELGMVKVSRAVL